MSVIIVIVAYIAIAAMTIVVTNIIRGFLITRGIDYHSIYERFVETDELIPYTTRDLKFMAAIWPIWFGVIIPTLLTVWIGNHFFTGLGHVFSRISDMSISIGKRIGKKG